MDVHHREEPDFTPVNVMRFEQPLGFWMPRSRTERHAKRCDPPNTTFAAVVRVVDTDAVKVERFEFHDVWPFGSWFQHGQCSGEFAPMSAHLESGVIFVPQTRHRAGAAALYVFD